MQLAVFDVQGQQRVGHAGLTGKQLQRLRLGPGLHLGFTEGQRKMRRQQARQGGIMHQPQPHQYLTEPLAGHLLFLLGVLQLDAVQQAAGHQLLAEPLLLIGDRLLRMCHVQSSIR